MDSRFVCQTQVLEEAEVDVKSVARCNVSRQEGGAVAELKIDDATMTGLVTKALVEGLSPETRQTMIEDSIKAHLLAKPAKRNYYDPEPLSPLQEAFNRAAYQVALDVCRESLTKDQAFRDKVKQLYMDACARLFDKPDAYELLVMKLAGAIDAALTKSS